MVVVVDRRQHGRNCRGETQCEWCEVSLPFKQLHQHLNGRRHNSTRFYGDSKHVVRPIEQRNSIGGRVRMLKPSEVNDRLVHIVRRVREVATQGIPFASRAATHARPVPPPAPSTSTGLAVAADAMVTGLLDTAAAPSTTASRRPGPFVTSASARPRSPAADIFAEKCFFF